MVGKIANCDSVWREISSYVDGEVEAGLQAAMSEHFSTCKRCASVLAGMRNVVALYGDERMLEVPAGFSARLQQRLAINAAGSRRRWSSWSAWLVPVAAMALIAASLMITNGHDDTLRSQHAPSAAGVPLDMVVVVSSGARLFHRPGCDFIHDKASERTITAKQAIEEGYVACPRCLRQYLKTSVSGHPAEVGLNSLIDRERSLVR